MDARLCVFVYSITERQSFHYVTDILEELRRSHVLTPAILVANKSDLV